MKKILIILTHPRFEKSKTNRILLERINDIAEVTLNDLYEQYPDFNIDIEHEKELLTSHDVIIWHYPFYNYGAPAMLKHWIDQVLEYGWAHGAEGNNLQGKFILNALTTGGTREVYLSGGRNRFTIRQFLFPFEQIAYLCKMIYLPPFVVHGTHLLTDQTLADYALQYRILLGKLAAGLQELKTVNSYEYINDWLNKQ